MSSFTRYVRLLFLFLFYSLVNAQQCFDEYGEPELCWCEGTSPNVVAKVFGERTSALVQTTPPNYRVAFFGDLGIWEDGRSVLQLIQDEGADAIVHAGDFDYTDDPESFEALIEEYFPSPFPYFFVVGNHDRDAWGFDPDHWGDWSTGYQAMIDRRTTAMAAQNTTWCDGPIGVAQVCIHRGITLFNSGAGTMCEETTDDWITDVLANHTDSVFKVCHWHKNQEAMQLGGKSDEVGWHSYEACREAGALIATGHEHSYARSKLMTHMESQTLAPEPDPDIYNITNGATVAWVSGLGGIEIRPATDGKQDNPWWASVWHSGSGAGAGAEFASLFCDFHVDGIPNKASCYLKSVLGTIHDSWDMMFLGDVECGNGVKGPDEECDDGNLADGDGCSAVCLLERCGDGAVNNNGSEQCDGGQGESQLESCEYGLTECVVCIDCILENGTTSYCGDGIVDSLYEDCDDNGTVDNDGCDSSCRNETCGDGVVNSGWEECDDGNDTPFDGCTNCTVDKCSPGSFGNGTACTLCPLGFYQPGSGESSCTPCPANQTTMSTGSDSSSDCVYCSLGQFLNASQCQDCSRHSYNGLEGQASCIACGPETVSAANETGRSTECPGCPAGSVPNTLKTECVQCPRGAWSHLGDLNCTLCPVGSSTSPGEYAQSPDDCRPCPAGSFFEEDARVCTLCFEDTYQPDSGASSCVPCPPSSTLPRRGGKSREECQEGSPESSTQPTGIQSTYAALASLGIVVFFVVVYKETHRRHDDMKSRKPGNKKPRTNSDVA